MLLEKGKTKFNWKPKKGSFKKIQEGVLRKQGLNEEATPEQEALHKKYGFMDAADVDPAWIKKNNMEKVWSRKGIDPRSKKLANDFSKEIKKLGGLMDGNNIDMSKVPQLKQAMKKYVSTSKGFKFGDPFEDVITLQGINIQAEPNYDQDWISIMDHPAHKEIEISFKDGKISIHGGGMGGWGSPAANAEEAEEGLYTGYII